MPYTIEELQTLNFYNTFRDTFRSLHLGKLVDYAKNKFRDSNNVLYSFESIERDELLGIGVGIESSELLKTQTGPYSQVPSLLNKAELEFAEENVDFFLKDVGESVFLDDFEALVRNNSQSKQLVNSYPDYDRRTLNSVVDRSFSELITFAVAESLPEGISNGDVITRIDALDYTKWLVEGNQKRKFATTTSFYGEDFNYSDVKAVSNEILDAIPDGEPVE